MRSRLLGWIFALVAPLATAPSFAAELLPDPARSPAEVIAIQLSALQANDTPEPDAGIAQTFAFAHPDNRRVTGPLSRFAQMIKGPQYQVLLGHRSHEIREVVEHRQRGGVCGDRHQPGRRGRGLPLGGGAGRRWRACRRLDDHRGLAARPGRQGHLISSVTRRMP